MLHSAEKAFADFEQKARQEGFERGIELGKLKVARSMLEKGMEVALIAELTDLTEQEIESFGQLEAAADTQNE